MFINRDTTCFIDLTLLFKTLFSVIAHIVGIVIQFRLNTSRFFFSYQNAQLNILWKLSAMNTDPSGNDILSNCFRLLTTEICRGYCKHCSVNWRGKQIPVISAAVVAWDWSRWNFLVNCGKWQNKQKNPWCPCRQLGKQLPEETDISNYAIILCRLNIFHTPQCNECTSLHSQYAIMLQEMN